MKVRPTCADSAGNGYYRGTDGKYYYGNVKNGYLKETLEERNKRLAKMRSEQKAENLRVKQKKGFHASKSNRVDRSKRRRRGRKCRRTDWRNWSIFWNASSLCSDSGCYGTDYSYRNYFECDSVDNRFGGYMGKTIRSCPCYSF